MLINTEKRRWKSAEANLHAAFLAKFAEKFLARSARAEINNEALICKAARLGLLNVYQNQIRERKRQGCEFDARTQRGGNTNNYDER
jgi:hypothetical protein